MTSTLIDIVRTYLPIFLVSYVGKEPHKFLNGFFKVLSAMGVNSEEKAELPLYQLREVFQVWYTQSKDNWPVESGPIEWEEFKRAFLQEYFSRERR